MDREKILKTAQEYILKGQIEKAIREYQKIVKGTPKDIRARLKLGDLYLKSGESEKAIEEYLRVAELYEEEDLNSRAISSYKKVLSLNPKLIEAYYKIAELYLKEGLTGDAKNCYQSILKMRPHDQKALEGLRDLAQERPPKEVSQRFPHQEITPSTYSTPAPQSRGVEEVIPLTSPLPPEDTSVTFQTEPSLEPAPALETEPPPPDKDSEMHYHLGIAYKEMELFDYAISEFEQAALNPAIQFDSYIMLGNCFMEKGAYDKSIEHFRMASEIKGLSKDKLARINFNLGLAYEANGMISEALDAYQLAMRLDPSSEAKEKIRRLQEK
ncbi:MAG: tetratricopeptide repeat protein [Thermodesulfobacteriota bacterium]